MPKTHTHEDVQRLKWAAWQLCTYVAPCIAVARLAGGDLGADVGTTGLPLVAFAAGVGVVAFALHRIRSWWVGGPEAGYGRN